jgi:hypothetical protein
MTRLLAAALLAASLSACVRPEINVCSTANACRIEVCTTGETCKVEPLELKGL